jgi:hypothetical protein
VGLRGRVVGWFDAVAEEGLLPAAWRRLRHHLFREGDVAGKLIPGEVVHFQGHHHRIYFVGPALQVLASFLLLLVWLPQVGADAVWVPIAVCGGLGVWGWYRLLSRTRYLLVITDSRVFRIDGVYTRYEGEMPLSRVLDIAVQRPWYLTWAHCGHLVLENAAQTQGLRDIRWIAEPQQRARQIHQLRTLSEHSPARATAGYRPRASHAAAHRPRPRRY